MSYILEALKKAQAERQLGSTPGINEVLAPSAAAAAAPSVARYWIAGGVLAVLAVALTGFRMMSAAADPPKPAAPAPVQVAKLEPPAAAPAPVIQQVVVPVKAEPASTQPAIEPKAAEPAPAAPPMQPPVPTGTETNADDSLPTLAQLSPAVRGTIPNITSGGYIYSPIPAERLLLIDNNLRREGEEVAPGLVLERLLPRAAVLNYRGTRFRMPY